MPRRRKRYSMLQHHRLRDDISYYYNYYYIILKAELIAYVQEKKKVLIVRDYVGRWYMCNPIRALHIIDMPNFDCNCPIIFAESRKRRRTSLCEEGCWNNDKSHNDVLSEITFTRLSSACHVRGQTWEVLCTRKKYIFKVKKTKF